MSWDILFSGWETLARTAILGTLGYVSLVVMLRVSGKRTLSKMSGFDLVVTIALGSTLASILVSSTVSLAQGLLSLALLVGLQFVNMFIAVRWPRYQHAIQDEPTLVFRDGTYLRRAMRKQRLTEDEIRTAMRSNGFTDPEQVAAVVLESDGSLSVLSTTGPAMAGVHDHAE